MSFERSTRAVSHETHSPTVPTYGRSRGSSDPVWNSPGAQAASRARRAARMPRSGNSANDGSGREALAMAHTAMATSRSMNVSPSFFRVPSLNKLAQLSTSRDGERSSSRPHGLTPKAHLAASERRRIRAMEQGYGARGQRAASDSGGSAGSFGIMGFDAPTGAEVSDKSTALLNAADEDRSLLALDMEEGPAKHEGTTGMLKSVFNLANTTVGAGTLALPYFFSQAGLGLGCSLLFSIALLSCYSLHLLSRCRSCDAVLAANGGAAASSYLDVAFFAFERKGRIVVTLVMLCLCFGALVAYFVIIGTLLEQVVATIVSHASLQSFADALTQRKLHWLLESEFLQVCAMVFPIAPLGSLKNLSSLSIVSLLSLLAIAYLIGLVCQDGVRAMVAGTTKSPGIFLDGKALFYTIPSVGLAFTNQPNIYEIVDELHNPTPRRIACVSYSATAVCVILYLVVGVFGYLRFGDTTATNILLNYQDDLTLVETVLFSTGKLGMAGSMMVSYPLLLFPCRLCLHTLVGMLPGAVEHALLKMCGCELPRCLKSCEVSGQVWFYGETFIIIFGTYVVSVLVPNIVKVFGLTGALTGSFVVFIMPAAFSLQLLPGKCCDLAKLPTWGLLLFGVAFMVVSLTFITIGMVQDAAAAAGGGGAAGGGNGTVPGRHNATNGSAWFI